MKHIFLVLILITLLAACSPAANLPEQFETWRLPSPSAERDTRVPVVWLGADGTEAVLGTGSSFTIASKDPNDPQGSGMPASPAEMGDELATASLAAEATAVIIISDEGGSIQSVSASVQSWIDITPENFALFAGRQVQGSGKQAGDIFTYTLEPLVTVEDRLLVVSIVFDNSRASGDIVMIWRLNPNDSAAAELQTAVSQSDSSLDYIEFMEALQAGGAMVEPAGTFTAAFFTGAPRLLKINDTDLQVFEYADEATSEKEAGEISPDGVEIVIPAEWVTTPHFFHTGRIIVQYIGDDPAILALLESILGSQVAGGVSETSANLVVEEITQNPLSTPSPSKTPRPTSQPTATWLPHPTNPKSVLIQFGSFGGDVAYLFPWDYSFYSIPELLIFIDGQMILRENGQLTDSVLSAAEMCGLLTEIEKTGFFQVEGDGRLYQEDPIYNLPEDFFWGDGLPFIHIQINGEPHKFVAIYHKDVVIDSLIDEVRAAYEILREFRPAETNPFMPEAMVLWVAKEDEMTTLDTALLAQWPSDLPPLAELLGSKVEGQVVLEEQMIGRFMELFPEGEYEQRFQENELFYLVIGRPLLPHENPGRFGEIPFLDKAFSLPFACDE